MVFFWRLKIVSAIASEEPEAAIGDLEAGPEISPRFGEGTSLSLGTISESPSELSLRPLVDIQPDKDEQSREDAPDTHPELSATVSFNLFQRDAAEVVCFRHSVDLAELPASEQEDATKLEAQLGHQDNYQWSQ